MNVRLFFRIIKHGCFDNRSFLQVVAELIYLGIRSNLDLRNIHAKRIYRFFDKSFVIFSFVTG
jgi:hypothetical protein